MLFKQSPRTLLSLKETARYGEYSKAGEFVYDHPFQWGSKRTGPDLARLIACARLTSLPGVGDGLAAVITQLATRGSTSRPAPRRARRS
mgnify:CR=1 FL=1